jgi:hypothetical protein
MGLETPLTKPPPRRLGGGASVMVKGFLRRRFLHYKMTAAAGLHEPGPQSEARIE